MLTNFTILDRNMSLPSTIDASDSLGLLGPHYWGSSMGGWSRSPAIYQFVFGPLQTTDLYYHDIIGKESWPESKQWLPRWRRTRGWRWANQGLPLPVSPPGSRCACWGGGQDDLVTLPLMKVVFFFTQIQAVAWQRSRLLLLSSVFDRGPWLSAVSTSGSQSAILT